MPRRDPHSALEDAIKRLYGGSVPGDIPKRWESFSDVAILPQGSFEGGAFGGISMLQSVPEGMRTSMWLPGAAPSGTTTWTILHAARGAEAADCGSAAASGGAGRRARPLAGAVARVVVGAWRGSASFGAAAREARGCPSPKICEAKQKTRSRAGGLHGAVASAAPGSPRGP